MKKTLKIINSADNKLAHPAAPAAPAATTRTTTTAGKVQFGAGQSDFKARSLQGPSMSSTTQPRRQAPIPVHSDDPKDIMKGFIDAPTPQRFLPNSEPPKTASQEADAKNIIKGFTDAPTPQKDLVTTPPKIINQKKSVTSPPANINNANSNNSNGYLDILEHGSMVGYEPSVVNQVLTLKRYPADEIKTVTRIPVVAKPIDAPPTSTPPSAILPITALPATTMSTNLPKEAEPVVTTTIQSGKVCKKNSCKEVVRYDDSYSTLEKFLIALNIAIFCGILFTGFLFLRVYCILHPEETALWVMSIWSWIESVSTVFMQFKLPQHVEQMLTTLKLAFNN
jgi:hypothetical protein